MVGSHVFLVLFTPSRQVLVLEVLAGTEVERKLNHGALVHLIAERHVRQSVPVQVLPDSVGSVQSAGEQCAVREKVQTDPYLENLMETPRGDLVLSSSPATIRMRVV